MPHKCTKCEHVFVDGDANILNGCPECGWNKFLYVGNRASRNEDKKKAETAAENSGVKEIDDVLGNDAEEETKTRQEKGPRVESIRILEKGSYELNIDALMTRKELVMAMKEDGAYEIHLPSMFKEIDKGKKGKKSKKS
ncbi:MAG: Zn-ribbon domain-containing protein [Methanosarcinales archaeon]|nr:Zn-ribbon domain-containing protein [Methanosarcinales archaeon]